MTAHAVAGAPGVAAPRRPGGARLLRQLLRTVSWAEWRAHLWRQAAAWVAVALGVALGLSVHLINTAALGEFSAAVRAANGQPDASVRCSPACSDALVEQLALLPEVASAHPVLELGTYVLARDGRRVQATVLGVDGLSVAAVAPDLWPRPAEGEDRLALLAPDRVFPNAAALAQTGWAEGERLQVQQGSALQEWVVGGQVAAGGAPLLVMDIDAAQHRLGLVGQVTRIDLRLQPGWTGERAEARLQQALQQQPGGWPAQARWHQPDEEAQAVSAMSRAYRVNLTVLALVALFVGVFLVFSVMALSVAQRMPQFALLGVLGLSAQERRRWVLAEAALTGAVGAVLGVGLGLGLAQAALHFLAGDLGGGYFPGVSPALQWSAWELALFGGLGVLAAVAGGWLPSREVEALSPAQALKGLGGSQLAPLPRAVAPLLLLAGVVLTQLPPVAGLPLAAYASVACLLLGGIAGVPWVVQGVLGLLRRLPGRRSAPVLLALERAHHERHTATVAVAGVVASLSLAVALTVMVGSFRVGVTQWLDQVLPADLYARTATRSSASDGAYLPGDAAQRAAQIPGVMRAEASRLRSLTLAPGRPPVTLIARPLTDPAGQLPLTTPLWRGERLPGVPGVYVSEAMQSLYGAEPGTTLALPLPRTEQDQAELPAQMQVQVQVQVQVLGVWRDYARQFGAVVMDTADYQTITGDTRVNDLALWLQPGADLAGVQAALQQQLGGSAPMEFAVPREIRAQSLRVFDRSFAVTRYLQGLAIAIGLFGIAASFSAQVLSRRREFGLLAHLGFTRQQVLVGMAAEGAAWTAAGALLGTVLGLAVAAVLVMVVNPQSFHWTMPLVVPWDRLALMAAGVVVLASAAAALSARAAVSVQAVRAVKEDW